MLMEDDDVLNYVFTLLSHTKTFINSCQLIEDMLQSKRQVLDLHRISKYNLNGLCNQCPSQLMLWVRISMRVRCTALCDKVCQWLATGQWFSPVPSINKSDCHDITAILVMGTDCIGSCKSNYFTITITILKSYLKWSL
jgi:hypothetical protein